MIRRLGIAGVLAVAAATRASAQCGQSGPATPPAVRGAMVGLITDDNNNPLEHVEVILSQPRRKVSTNSKGQFAITDLPPGKYPITVRRIGYEPGTAEVDVTAEGASARICIDVEPEPLAPLVTSVSRGGLSGTVGDSLFNVLPGADVHAIGTNKSGVTDSAGAFFLDIKPGTYGLQVTKKGFGTRVIAVTIPKDSGRKVAIWLRPMTPGQQRRQAYALDSMRWRYLLQGTGNNLFSSEDLMKTSRALGQVIGQRAVAMVGDDCEAVVDGEYTLPLWAIDKDEVELMEVYPHSGSSRGQKSMISGASRAIQAQQPAAPSCGWIGVYIWLKK